METTLSDETPDATWFTGMDEDLFTEATAEPDQPEVFYDYEEENAEDHAIVFHVLDGCIAVAVFINAFLLLTVLTSKKLRHGAAAALVISLAVADILHLVGIRVCLHYMEAYRMEPGGDVACKLGMFVDSMFHGMAVFLLVVIARERYLAVVCPLSFQKRSGSPLQWSIQRAIAATALALVLAIPDYFLHGMVDDPYEDEIFDANVTTVATTTDSPELQSDDYQHDETYTAWSNETSTEPPTESYGHRTCEISAPEWLYWYKYFRPGFGFGAYYVVPMTLICLLYVPTAWTLARSSVQDRRGSGEHRKKREQAARSVVILIIIVVLCLLPINILDILLDYELVDVERLRIFAYVSLFVFVLNTSFNAIMVCVLSQQYRRQVLTLLGVRACRRRKRRSRLEMMRFGAATETRRRGTAASSSFGRSMSHTGSTHGSSTDDHSNATSVWTRL